jgi:hypothetical protein
MRALVPLVLAVLLASCATPEPVQPPQEKVVEPEKPVVISEKKPRQGNKIESQPLKHLAGRKLKPIPDKELDVRTRCSFKDVQGGKGSMDLQVTKAEVKRFVAEVTIPKQGLCRFDMKHFEQTARMPNVVLTDRASACTVRMWEQDKGVTVAFNGCQAKCSGDAFSYLWPILVDTRSGRCA